MDVLINALQNSEKFNHPVKAFSVIQTHLSWVILTGTYAYKIKKPLNLGFQDFTTLEKRKHFCEMELELNKRLADDLYLDVLPITGTPENPQINGDGPIIEYTIKMREFPQDMLLDRLAQKHQITPSIIQEIATQLAKFHQEAAPADKSTPYGTYPDVINPMIDNFNALKDMPFANPFQDTLQKIETWSTHTGDTLKSFITQRNLNGWTKACHGDVHLGNMVLMDNQPIIFDCIEFNESFRFTDTMNDVGFFFMDLHHKQLPKLAQLFINHYLEQIGDYEGALLLNFYACYRAMVRAKVTGFMLLQTDETDDNYPKLLNELEAFIKLAQQFTCIHHPSIYITHGPSGSGKSYYTEKNMQQENTLRLRSDIIRKQMFKIPIYKKTPPEKLKQVYSGETTEKVYKKMHALTKAYIKEGFSVIIDAACLKRWQRQLFADLAIELSVPFKILSFTIDAETLKKRLEQRLSNQQEVSDATIEVLELQLNTQEPLSNEEYHFAKMIESEAQAC